MTVLLILLAILGGLVLLATGLILMAVAYYSADGRSDWS